MKEKLNFVKDVESYHTGGGCMVDILTLDDGTALVIGDECVCLYTSAEHFFLAQEEYLPEAMAKRYPDGAVNGIRGVDRLGIYPADPILERMETELVHTRVKEDVRLQEITRLLNEALLPATYEHQMGGGCQGVSIDSIAGYWLYTDGHTEPVIGLYPDKESSYSEPGTMFPICETWTVVPEELAAEIIKTVYKADTEAMNKDMSDGLAMDALFDLLDGKEWSAETLDQVAEIISATGRTITDPNE